MKIHRIVSSAQLFELNYVEISTSKWILIPRCKVPGASSFTIGTAHQMTGSDCTTSRDHFVNASSQWETILQCNVVSHWLLIHGGLSHSHSYGASSTLVRAMACRLFGTKPLPEPILTCCELNRWNKNLRLQRKWQHFPEISKSISFSENHCVLVQISLKFVLKGYKWTLLEVMAWHWTCGKSLPE